MATLTRRDVLAALSAAGLAASCQRHTSDTQMNSQHEITKDFHSFSEPENIRVEHVSLNLEVSFEKRTLTGQADLTLKRRDGYSGALALDTRDLQIAKVEDSADGQSFRDARWTFGAHDPILGTPLSVNVGPDAKYVRIHYSSQPQASGLQWLQPEQTAGKTHPFLFSQNESIHARSWIPLQDSPGVRMTYTAKIKVPPQVVALMSAEHKGNQEGVYEFAMENPIPAYLIALAVGRLDFSATGPRTGVYAEPPLLQKAAWEFADMEKLVATVEQLYGPYRWGRYDLLILPPSFPFGGMENPRLTFATPTVIAGDRSLVGLVSHELAHSWSGNLVTNATWSDFWLNEGFTTYIENRIQEAVYGREQALMEQVLSRRELDQELKDFAPRDQILHIDLKGRDPDDGSTQVPYIKGALFLRQMEEVFGRPAFDAYLKDYFHHFAFQSIPTATALEYLRQQLLNQHADLAAKIPVQEWVYQPGLPASAPRAVSQRLEAVHTIATQWASGALPAAKIDTKHWSTQEWLEFLQVIPAPVTAAQLADLDRQFHLTNTGNDEILDQWLQMAVQANYQPAYPRLESFLMTVGRQKFIKPLYVGLMKTADGQKRARAIYAKARERYHPIAQTAIDKILNASKNP